MKAMILAAGEGNRLRPLTVDQPKPMLPVAARPALEYTVRWLRYHGIFEILINLHHCPEVVMRYLGDGAVFGVSIEYSVEERIMGTAGGAKQREDFFNGSFVVVYGDVLTDLDLSSLITYHESRTKHPHLTMSLYRERNPERCGVACVNEHGLVSRFVEKPAPGQAPSDLASAGVLVVDREILRYIPQHRFCDYGRDLFPVLLRDGVPMYGWLLPESTYLIDFGTLENYTRAQQEWPTRRAHIFLYDNQR
jgi:NDP-sugar pyrophosphorylase family protein